MCASANKCEFDDLPHLCVSMLRHNGFLFWDMRKYSGVLDIGDFDRTIQRNYLVYEANFLICRRYMHCLSMLSRRTFSDAPVWYSALRKRANDLSAIILHKSYIQNHKHCITSTTFLDFYAVCEPRKMLDTESVFTFKTTFYSTRAGDALI